MPASAGRSIRNASSPAAFPSAPRWSGTSPATRPRALPRSCRSPAPSGCPIRKNAKAAPVALRQIHGYNDHTFPLAGRRIGLLWQQGNTDVGLGILRKLDQCPDKADTVTHEGKLECTAWTQCGGGQVQLCLHDGDHELNPDWFASGLRWAFAQ